ncbi:MAG TPA: TolC family protein [Acidobacteriaceae bacterium]|jgi:outer membrane protein TolC|nr:TolC family protein [Acidobacteriaceae bacterium]
MGRGTAALCLAVAVASSPLCQAQQGALTPRSNSGAPGGAYSSSGTVSQSGTQQSGTQQNPFQGGVTEGKATGGVMSLSLDDAIKRGLRNNLGYILQSVSVKQAGGQRLQELQPLLPTINGEAKIQVSQIDLQAQGINFAGVPAIVGPFQTVDFRASLTQAVLNLPALRNYIAAKHEFEAAKLSVDDASDMVVLAVGNAYLTVVADAARVVSVEAQVGTSKVSLDQAVSQHAAGTAPKLDELRARVDFQTQQQQLIQAQNDFEKDKIALARAIGLPLDQQFTLSDTVPYSELVGIDQQAAIQQALDARSDVKALREQVKAAESSESSARAERYPAADIAGDYGDIGITPGHSHGTGEVAGRVSAPIFEEARLRGDLKVADAQLQQRRAQLNDAEAQVRADVIDSLLDLQASAKLVEVSRSNVDLTTEALKEAQDRYAAGVSDNLPVSQAQTSLAQANDQYVGSLYEHNLAKLSLARALGRARNNYKTYLGGK